VYLIRECGDDVSEKGGAFHLPGVLVEFDIGELRDPINGEEQDEFAVGVCEFAAVDMDVANIVGFEPLPLFRGLTRGQARDTVALKAPMQGTSAEIGYGVFQTAENVIQWQKCPASKLNDDCLLG